MLPLGTLHCCHFGQALVSCGASPTAPGSAPPQSPALAEAAAELQAVQEWAELAEQHEAAEQSVEQARAEAETVEQVCGCLEAFSGEAGRCALPAPACMCSSRHHAPAATLSAGADSTTACS